MPYSFVFFHVRLLLGTYFYNDSLVPNPGSRSRLQPHARIYSHVYGCVITVTVTACAYCNGYIMTAVAAWVSVL